MKVPGFLVRRFYVSGSLRNTERGFTLQAQNPLGDGRLVGVGRLRVDGVEIPPSAVTAVRESDGATYRASDVRLDRPIEVRKGDRVTLHVDGEQLPPGSHRLEVVLSEEAIGPIQFSVTDSVP